MGNYKARFYSTVLGRFVSVDPVVGDAGDPQSWNAYTYVGNNPLRYVDPTGMCLTDMDGPRGCGADRVQPDNGCYLACLEMKAAARAYEEAAHQQLVSALQALACEACKAWRELASAGQGVDFYHDLAGGASADADVYQPKDLVADLSPLTDLKDLLDPHSGLDERGLALLFLGVPGPGSGARRAAGPLKDIVENPRAWRLVGARAEAATVGELRGTGRSVERLYEHAGSGERLMRHTLVDKTWEVWKSHDHWKPPGLW